MHQQTAGSSTAQPKRVCGSGVVLVWKNRAKSKRHKPLASTDMQQSFLWCARSARKKSEFRPVWKLNLCKWKIILHVRWWNFETKRSCASWPGHKKIDSNSGVVKYSSENDGGKSSLSRNGITNIRVEVWITTGVQVNEIETWREKNADGSETVEHEWELRKNNKLWY